MAAGAGALGPKPSSCSCHAQSGENERDNQARLSLKGWKTASARSVPDGQTAPRLPGCCFPGIQPWMLPKLPSLPGAAQTTLGLEQSRLQNRGGGKLG